MVLDLIPKCPIYYTKKTFLAGYQEQSMKEEQQTGNHKTEPQQVSSNEMISRRSDKMPGSSGFGDMKGIVGIVIWFLIVILICGLIYLLS
jgi:hypothetical protein